MGENFLSLELFLKIILLKDGCVEYSKHCYYAHRKNQKHANQLDIQEVHATPKDIEAFKECEFTREELEKAIDVLPQGYGMVFKLYVIDGYKHKEIAEMLGIEINTSKSQLSRAKKFLQNQLNHMSKKAKPKEEKK